jgi:hypothetical protein
MQTKFDSGHIIKVRVLGTQCSSLLHVNHAVRPENVEDDAGVAGRGCHVRRLLKEPAQCVISVLMRLI